MVHAGFADPVLDAAHAFRTLLDATARPGTLGQVASAAEPPGIGRAMAAVLLTLCDSGTPIVLSPALGEDIGAWSDFHTGAPRLAANALARAAFVFAPFAVRPSLNALEKGSDAYPDRAATLVAEVDRLAAGGRIALTGPGIDGTAHLTSEAFDDTFLAEREQNHALFPRGVDVILTCGDRLAALPRTTRLERA